MDRLPTANVITYENEVTDLPILEEIDHKLYINGILPLSNLMSGLLAGSGVALLILFKYNKNLKENIYILSIIYGVGVVSGIIIELLGVVLW